MAARKTTTDTAPVEVVSTFLPADPMVHGNSSSQEFFSVNGENILVKTDEIVSLPKKFAEVVSNSAKARMSAKKFAEENAFRDSQPPQA